MNSPNGFRPLLLTIALVPLSLLSAFFVTFNSVFSDVSGLTDRLITYAYAGIVYFILAAIFGALSPAYVRRWVWILSAPAVAILLLYTFSEPQNWLIHASFAILVPGASFAGTRVGAKMRNKKASI